MRKTEPRLQRKLLAWLLGPLLILLVLDTMAAYWVSLRFANLAYDRALHEIAREIVLHVKQAEGRPRLELSDAAANILLMDAQDRLFFRVEAADGALLGGERTLPPPPASQRGAGEPRFYEDQCAARTCAWWTRACRSTRTPARRWCTCRWRRP